MQDPRIGELWAYPSCRHPDPSQPVWTIHLVSRLSWQPLKIGFPSSFSFDRFALP
jgi:hypothetical protein